MNKKKSYLRPLAYPISSWRTASWATESELTWYERHYKTKVLEVCRKKPSGWFICLCHKIFERITSTIKADKSLKIFTRPVYRRDGKKSRKILVPTRRLTDTSQWADEWMFPPLTVFYRLHGNLVLTMKIKRSFSRLILFVSWLKIYNFISRA